MCCFALQILHQLTWSTWNFRFCATVCVGTCRIFRSQSSPLQYMLKWSSQQKVSARSLIICLLHGWHGTEVLTQCTCSLLLNIESFEQKKPHKISSATFGSQGLFFKCLYFVTVESSLWLMYFVTYSSLCLCLCCCLCCKHRKKFSHHTAL